VAVITEDDCLWTFGDGASKMLGMYAHQSAIIPLWKSNISTVILTSVNPFTTNDHNLPPPNFPYLHPALTLLPTILTLPNPICPNTSLTWHGMTTCYFFTSIGITGASGKYPNPTRVPLFVGRTTKNMFCGAGQSLCLPACLSACLSVCLCTLIILNDF